MATEVETRSRILEEARRRFFRSGYAKVTVDEIVSGLGMSKKTFYRFFKSKEKLLHEVIETALARAKRDMELLMEDEGIDFIEKLKRLMVLIGFQLSRISRPLMEDVQKYFPAMWREIERFRREELGTYFGGLVKDGIRSGVFRKDIDLEILEPVYANAVQNTVTPETLSRLPLTADEAFGAIIKVVFEGILTDEARRELPVRVGKGRKHHPSPAGKTGGGRQSKG